MTTVEIELILKDILYKHSTNTRPYETTEKAVKEIMKLINKK